MDLKASALGRLEGRLRACFFSDSTLADFSDDPYFWSGQNIRGKICLDLGAAYKLPEDILLDIAASTQLLHDASLIHDDLIDEDTERRGCAAIWKNYGKAKAILIGDLLISKAYDIATYSKVSDATKVLWTSEISVAVNSAVSGAVAELEFDAHNKQLILGNYYRMASLKTGALFALPARCIALTAKQLDDVDRLNTIFLNLAVAYQIKDDQSDFLGTKSGREYSSDLKNGRPNLYHILANNGMSTDKCFDYINDYQQSLVADSVQLANSLPKQVCVILKELLIPFIELKPLPSSSGLLQVGT
ncbi:polyprenyl synthetase family protein [Candidatus Pelagisphaera phototrophica]|uniref:polyprenyl synthetase family protein n=1 Tax=Candidatus Pelagisphaera phototrophica TaxID=2684113 RepID=UPI0019E146B8|nr:polyprenyl synthetase family protein [Candidatus Pelagisphaera phototrophica]QXD31194.1 polyprenyl synthetase family protein [Candidatus Pelagisphaera phototrophica]